MSHVSGSFETLQVMGSCAAVVPQAIVDGPERVVRFADPPVVASALQAFEGRLSPAGGGVELLLGEGRRAPDEQRGTGVGKHGRDSVTKLTQASMVLGE